jgi:hypothetical protein
MNNNLISDQKTAVGGLNKEMHSLSRVGSVSKRRSIFANYIQSRDIDGEFSAQNNNLSKNTYTEDQAQNLLGNNLLEKTSDRNDKSVYFGDIIYINWSIRDSEKAIKASGVIFGDKYANKPIQFINVTNGISDFTEEECLFQIVNLSEYGQDVELTAKQRMLLQKYNIFALKDMKKINERESETESKIRLLYGQGFSLKHLSSGKFLGLKVFSDSNNDQNVRKNHKGPYNRFILAKEDEIDSYFKFYPNNSLIQVGTPMDYEDLMFFKDELKHTRLNLDMKNSKWDDCKLTFNTKELTEWKFYFYSDSRHINSLKKDNLKRCDIIQIFDSESNEYLVCEPKISLEGEKDFICFPTENKSTELAFIEVYNGGSKQKEDFPVKFSSDAKNSVYSFWQVKSRKPFDNSLLTNEDEIVIINLITKTFLTLHLGNSNNYSLLAESHPSADTTQNFQIYNFSMVLASNKIDINSKFTIKAKIGGQTDQRVDVMSVVFKQPIDMIGTIQPNLNYSALSMKKFSEESKNLITIIDLKFSFEQLNDFFFTWRMKLYHKSLEPNEGNKHEGKLYQYDQEIDRNIFDEKLTVFKSTLKTLQNMLLNDYSNFDEIDQGVDKNAVIGSVISQQVADSKILNILINILNLSVARYYKMGQIILFGACEFGHNVLDNYDCFSRLHETLNKTENQVLPLIIEESENYKKLIHSILKFLSRFSYKNKHFQAVILDKIETIFPLLPLYNEFVKKILMNILTNRHHPKIQLLQSFIIEKFTKGDKPEYLLSISNMYNLVAKAIKHNHINDDFQKEHKNIKIRIKKLSTIIDEYNERKEALKKKWGDEEHQILLMASTPVKDSKEALKLARLKNKSNTLMNKNLTLQNSLASNLKEVNSPKKKSNALEKDKNSFAELPSRKMTLGNLKENSNLEFKNQPDAMPGKINAHKRELDQLIKKEAEFSLMLTIKELLFESFKTKSNIITFNKEYRNEMARVPSKIDIVSNKDISETIIIMKEEEEDDFAKNQNQGSVTCGFFMHISKGKLIRRTLNYMSDNGAQPIQFAICCRS